MKRPREESALASDLRTVLTRLIKKMRSASPSAAGLSLTERATMAQLDKTGELSPTELAEKEKITNQSMSAIIRHLTELGFIIKRSDRSDKRRSVVSLSKAGRDKLMLVRSERDEWLSAALTDACNSRDLETLKRSIVPLTKLVDYNGGTSLKEGGFE